MTTDIGTIFTNDNGEITLTEFCGPNHELRLQVTQDIGKYVQLSQLQALYLVDHLIKWLDGKIETPEMSAYLNKK